MVQLWISRPSMAHVMILQAFCVEAVLPSWSTAINKTTRGDKHLRTFFGKFQIHIFQQLTLNDDFPYSFLSPTKKCVDFASSSYLFV